MATANMPITGSLESRRLRMPATKPPMAYEGDVVGEGVRQRQEKLQERLLGLEEKKIGVREKELEVSQKELAQRQKSEPLVKALGVASSGMGQQAYPTASTSGAVAGTISSGIQGAGAGAQIGGTYGAIAGGILGLVSGGIGSYERLKAAREERRRQDRDARRIRALNERARRDQMQQIRFNQNMQRQEMAMNREKFAASQEQMNYGRKLDRLKARWDMVQDARNQFNRILQGNEALKQAFINRAR